MIDKAKELWVRLSPQNKRNVTLLAVAAPIVLILYMFVAGDESDKTDHLADQDIVQDVFVSRGATSRLGVEALAAKITTIGDDVKAVRDGYEAQLKAAEARNQQLENRLRTMQTEVENRFRAQEQHLAGVTEELDTTVRAIATDVVSAATLPAQTGADGSAQIAPPTAANPAGLVVPARDIVASRAGGDPLTNDEFDIFADNHVSFDEGAGSGSGRSTGAGAPRIRTIENPAIATQLAAQSPAKQMDYDLPAGSIIQGVLITGMDAPTGTDAEANPVPALVRVKHEAIMPNRHHMDIVDCHILLSGYGQLSTERVQMRTLKMTCKREGGDTIDVGLAGFVSGDDGKAGLRGQVVDKLGKVLLKSLLADFAAGVGQAFTPQAVPIISNDPNSSLFTPANQNRALEAGVGGGIGGGLNSLAEFYRESAEGLFPVIEVDAGRPVEIILTETLTMQLS